MGLGSSDNVISVTVPSVTLPASHAMATAPAVAFREATTDDVDGIQTVYRDVYGGRYPEGFANDPRTLAAEINDRTTRLWLVAEDKTARRIAGAVGFLIDPRHRLGKVVGAVVLSTYRGAGIGASLIRFGVDRLTKTGVVDVAYATTRTVSQAPPRMVADAGFRPLGIFPNVVQVERFEHLSLDVHLGEAALAARRKRPYLFPPFLDTYEIARKALGLEKAALVTERAPLKLSTERLDLRWEEGIDAEAAHARCQRYAEEQRLSRGFFPFHRANGVLVTADGGTEVFVRFAGPGRQAVIVGHRTDRVNVHDLLDAVATALQREGAAYVELLVDAYDYKHQQEAFTARYLPSAYFPAMKLNDDGLRDDFFILSRTFRLLDFTQTVLTGDALKFLRAYLKYYHELYLRPILGQ